MKSRKATSGSRGTAKTSGPGVKPKNLTAADYRLLIETFPQWVWMADATGATTFCNRYWYEFTGLSVEQVCRNEWTSVLHPDDRQRAAKIFQNSLATGKAYESEFRYRRARDGQYRWHLAKGLPLKDANGRVQNWIGFGIDIHDSKVAETELADRESRLRAIMDTGPECIKLLSPEGVLLEMNPAGLAMMEADSPGDVIGKKLIEKVVDKSYHQAFYDLNQQVFQGKEGTLSYEITGFKGAHRRLQTHATPLRDKNGKIWAALAITRDITQQKKAEDELRASEARFRALIEHSSDAVALIDGEGKIVFCSASVQHILNFRPDEMIGHSAYEFVHPEEHSRVREAFGKTMPQPGKAVEARARVRSKNGQWLVLEGVINNLQHDPNVGAIVVNFRDITERLWAEEALRGSQERFSKVFRVSPLPIIITTFGDARYVDANDAALALSGYSREEVIGRTAEELNLWVDQEARAEFVKKLREFGRVAAMQATFRTRSGEIRQVEHSADVIDLGGTRCILSIARDVTETKKMEAQFQQSQKMEAVGRLAGGVAHDFNNMLAVIVGYIQLLQDHLDPADPGQKHIEQIRKASERAAALTRQLLAFSRKQVVQPKVLNLNAVVNNLSKMLLRMIGEDVALKLVPGAPLGSVTADLGQLEQVLMNLAVNARDAMPHGGAITIETANVELKADHAQHHPSVIAGAYVMLSVADTGHGMDEQTMSRVFEPFFTTKGPGKGTGLGLSMVYGIVKQNHGYIWASSEPGKGATFKIYLPRVAKAAEPLLVKRTEPPIETGFETILVAEDDESLRELVFELLQESGYKVLLSDNVESAIEIARSGETIHLLLTDVIMPTMSGGELARRLLGMRPGLKVLYMSGYSGDLVANQGVLEAETALLEKPFTKHALLSKVRTVLDS